MNIAQKESLAILLHHKETLQAVARTRGRDWDIIVENITSIAENGHVLMHFMNGFKSESEYVKPENIIAIGDQIAGSDAIPFWKGKFHILLPEHPVLMAQQSSARGCPKDSTEEG